jgi:hypothetical protein
MRKLKRTRAVDETDCGLLIGLAFEAGAHSDLKQPLFDVVKFGFGNSTGI